MMPLVLDTPQLQSVLSSTSEICRAVIGDFPLLQLQISQSFRVQLMFPIPPALVSLSGFSIECLGLNFGMCGLLIPKWEA